FPFIFSRRWEDKTSTARCRSAAIRIIGFALPICCSCRKASNTRSGSVWSEADGGSRKGCADTQRSWLQPSEAQLRRWTDASGRRLSDGISDVCLGRNRGPSQHLQYEHVVVGRIIASSARLNVEIWFRDASAGDWPTSMMNLAPLILLAALRFFMIRQMNLKKRQAQINKEL